MIYLSYVVKEALDYMAFTLSLHYLIKDIKSVKLEVLKRVFMLVVSFLWISKARELFQ